MKKHLFTTRSQRRTLERFFIKAIYNPKTVPANDAFKVVKSALNDFGWTLDENFNNMVEIKGTWRATISPALLLHTEAFHITLIPHKHGIEISRMEVYKHFQGRGYAGNILKSILVFLLQNKIDDIFLIPGIAGSLEKMCPTSLDIYQLEEFYHKRGFKEMPKTGYWKLDKSTFLNFIKDENIGFELLNSSYVPLRPDDSVEKSLVGKSMEVKTKIYRRA